MTVIIQASGILKEQIPSDLPVEANSVGEALAEYDLSMAGDVLLLVNGRMAHWQTELHDGDVLKLVPAIGGGSAQGEPQMYGGGLLTFRDRSPKSSTSTRVHLRLYSFFEM